VIYGSVCSGIEAATAAWHPLGWKASFFSEIEAFPRSVLAHHYPETPLHGDFTTIKAGEYEPIDLLVGGTPCQSFSVAGLRGGLDDDRGNLALEYLRLADRLRPRWLVWENVPGVLSSNGGRDFGSILGGMGELGYGVAYRVLDAQFFGVAQRRRRVFVVGYLGDWRRAAAVLFERHSLSGNPAPRRKTREDVAGVLTSRASGGGGGPGAGTDEAAAGYLQAVAPTLRAGGNRTGGDRPPGTDVDTADSLIVAFDTTQITSSTNRSDPQPGDPCHTLAKGSHAPAIAFQPGNLRRGAGAPPSERVFPTLKSDHGRGLSDQHPHVAVAFTCSDQSNSPGWERPYAPTLNAQVPNDTSNIQTGVRIGSAVRRLTPRECERLQGFPDDFTLVPHRGKSAADGPRYKALGNSMAVPCMAWIGRRIDAVDALPISLAVAA